MESMARNNIITDAQWENGMIPHIVFRQNDPDYYPGPDIWNSNNEPPSSCLSQPPVLSSSFGKWLTRNSL